MQNTPKWCLRCLFVVGLTSEDMYAGAPIIFAVYSAEATSEELFSPSINHIENTWLDPFCLLSSALPMLYRYGFSKYVLYDNTRLLINHVCICTAERESSVAISVQTLLCVTPSLCVFYVNRRTMPLNISLCHEHRCSSRSCWTKKLWWHHWYHDCFMMTSRTYCIWDIHVQFSAFSA